MKQKTNNTLLKILVYSIFIYLVILPLFSLQVKKPKGKYISDNYTLVSFYNQGSKNKNITGLQEIAMVNQTIRTLPKIFHTNINRSNLGNSQKENKNVFLAFNKNNNFITKSQTSTISSINNIFPNNYSVSNQTKNFTVNKNTPVVKNIKSEILNIIPQNVKTLYSENKQVENSNIQTSDSYKYVSYINKPGGIALLRF